MNINIYTICTPSYKGMLNDYFLPRIPKSFSHTTVAYLNNDDAIPGYTTSPDFKKISFKKMRLIHHWIKSNIGDVIIFSDIDIVFFRDFKEDILTRITEYDMLIHGIEVCNYNAGFMVFKCTDKVLKFWEFMMENYNENNNTYENDQVALNNLISKFDITHGCLPKQYHLNQIWCNPAIGGDIDNTINAIPDDAFLCHFQAIQNGIEYKTKIMSETIKRR